MSEGADTGRSGPAGRVFISYAHDDDEHVDRVRSLWLFLRAQGIDARLDLPAAEQRLDWTQWITREIRDADYVLVIASPSYRKRAEGDTESDEGSGVQWEARLIRDRFYHDFDAGLRQILPVVLSGGAPQDIPSWLAPSGATFYQVNEYTIAGAEKLLRVLTNQPWETMPPLGPAPTLAAASARQWDFFISHTQTDRSWAEWIAWVLQESGYRVLIQAWDFVPGSNWIQSVQAGVTEADRTIAVLSETYLRSEFGSAEWQSAWAADPSGTQHRLLVVRVANCKRPGLLGTVASIDLFGVPEAEARTRLRNLVGRVLTGRAKPAVPPAFPGAGKPVQRLLDRPPNTPVFPTAARVWEVAQVFQPTGVPEVTFVQPEWFAEFRMALRQPGLSIVLEGPSGVGKTTLLQHAIEQDTHWLSQPKRFTARDPAHIAAITDLVTDGGHQGIAAIDDFHRLPADLQVKVVDYLKLLADRGDQTRKMVIVGIPQTAQSLVRISFDIANRIREFRLGWAPDQQVLDLIEQGENALNIAFDDKPALVAAAGGSLITAQSLCWHLMSLARIEETLADLVTVRTDVSRARERVFHELRLKYHEAVAEFVSLDDQAETACIDMLLALASELDGVLYLDTYTSGNPSQAAIAGRVLSGQADSAISASEVISRVLYYDPMGRRLIADDPQFVFYIRHLDRQMLMREAGKRLQMSRSRIFLCYSRANVAWLERLLVHLGPLHKDNLVDVWSDERIRPGDDWHAGIDAALAAARFAVLLVSADFYNSAFIRDVELPRLLAAADTGGCKVIPLLVSASRFLSDPALSRFQTASRNSRTLAAMTTEEAEQVLAGLAAAVEDEIRRSN